MPRVPKSNQQLLDALTVQATAVEKVLQKTQTKAHVEKQKEDELSAEQEALRFYRRKKLISASAYKREKAKLMTKQDTASYNREQALAKLKQESKKMKDIQTKQKSTFETIIENQFRAKQNFRLPIQHKFIDIKDIIKTLAKQKGQWTLKS